MVTMTADNEGALFASCPCCGDYKIDRECYVCPQILDGPRHLLAGFLRWRNIDGDNKYFVYSKSYDEIRGQTIEDHHGKRSAILRYLYKESDATTREVKLHPETEYTVGYCYDGKEFVGLLTDLRDEKFLEIIATGQEQEGWKVRLKTMGVDVAAGRISLGAEMKEQRTNNFTFYAPVGAVQSGDGAVAHVIQLAESNKIELLRLLAEIKGHAEKKLPEERVEEINGLVARSEQQLKAATPDRGILSISLKSLSEVVKTTNGMIDIYLKLKPYADMLFGTV